jgi:sarcosine oxidase
MSRDWDVVVVGLGALGSATAYWASRRPGTRVLGLERYEIGHLNGASEDVSRIIRRSYHRRDYVRLTARAYESWAEVGRESGLQVVFRTGGLDVGPRVTAPGVATDIGEYARAMTAEGVPFETLDGPEIVRRWPAWRLDDGHVGLFQADAGLADPSAGNVAHRRLAAAQGAVLREHAPVARIEGGDGETTVVLEDGEAITAGKVVVAADAWTNDLLGPLGAHLPLTVTQEQVSWFTPTGDPRLFDKDRFPIWIWMDEPSFYGFPTHGHPGPKVGQDVGGRPVTPATRTFERDDEALGRVTTFLEAHLPAMAVAPFRFRSCLYTLTPDRDFVLDAVPARPDILVALGSAHGYKFASVIGRIMAELGLDGRTPSAGEIEGFRFGRAALADPATPATFVI